MSCSDYLLVERGQRLWSRFRRSGLESGSLEESSLRNLHTFIIQVGTFI
jgi:hypothetical protein